MSEIEQDGLWNQIQGQWKQIAGRVREEFGELTDDEVMRANGDRQQLVGMIQAKYGIAQEEAAKRVDRWADQAMQKVEEELHSNN